MSSRHDDEAWNYLQKLRLRFDPWGKPFLVMLCDSGEERRIPDTPPIVHTQQPEARAAWDGTYIKCAGCGQTIPSYARCC